MLLAPEGCAGEVVPESVVVVRRRRDRKHDHVPDRERDGDGEHRDDRIAAGIPHASDRRAKRRRPRPAAEVPGNDGERAQRRGDDEQPGPRQLVDRRHGEGDDRQLGRADHVDGEHEVDCPAEPQGRCDERRRQGDESATEDESEEAHDVGGSGGARDSLR